MRGDIDEIVDHHCLNVLIIRICNKQPQTLVQ